MNHAIAPFPYFGGKRLLAPEAWKRLGTPKQYIEPFCGSAAMLLAAPRPASLEIIGDASGFIANFWRATKYQPGAVAEAADYPVSHVDLGARHGWLMEQRERIGAALQDPDWPGDAKVAGWWLWGQCCWIGSGWCDWIGKVPHASSAGMGIGSLLTSSGRAAWDWLHKIAERLERVRIVHGDWSRCLNNHYGGKETAIFLDPPYRAYEKLYGVSTSVVAAVEAWARENADLRIVLCGHIGDYDLPGWDAIQWSRGSPTYNGSKTTDNECVWYSPACDSHYQLDLFIKQPERV
jgi:hypothetical protein